MANFTKDQLKAIEHEGTNVLINAGAGSGKTTVLTNRIVNKLKKGTKVNELLVLTFTEAAAFEMKTRIINAIKNEEGLEEQLSLIPQSDITTFDSYMIKIVKKYGYVLDLDDNIKIGDEILLEKLLEDIVDDIFKKLYSQKDEDFLNLSKYYIFDDTSLKQNFISLYKQYDNLLDPNVLLDINIVDKFSKFEEYILNLKEQIKLLNLKLSTISPFEDLVSKYCEEVGEFANCNTYDDLVNIYISNSLPKQTSSKADGIEKVKNIQKEIRRIYLEIKDIIILKHKEDILEEENKLMSDKKTIFKLLKIIENDFLSLKKEKRIFNFQDITKFSIQIIEENNHIQNEIKSSFQEILVDEYQDTNDFQNKFINLISNNNSYFVGDLKQAIYGFRNANPHNFKEIENSMKKSSDAGIVINLLENFRSRDEVLQSVNHIFEKLMIPNFGIIDYQDNQALLYGNKSFEQKNQTQNYFMEMINYYKEDLVDYSKAHKEAFIIANDIKHKLEEGYQVLDNGSLRDCVPSDFCILTKYKGRYEDFKQVFNYFEIPITIQKESSLNNIENYELLVLTSILKLIVNSNDNVAKASVLRSFLYRIKEQELYDYLVKDKSSNVTLDLEEKITQIRKLQIRNLQTLLEVIIKEFDFFKNMVKIKEVSTINTRIQKIYSVAYDLSNSGGVIQDLIEYLEYAFADSKRTYEISSDNNIINSVVVMTIHKSKGLEFPIVYIAQMDNDIYKVNKEMLEINNKHLIIPQISNYVKEESFLKKYENIYGRSMAVEENIRLLYVAMTRAQEKVIFINQENIEKTKLTSAKKFAHLIDNIQIPISSFSKEELSRELYVDFKNTKISNKSNKIHGEPSFTYHELNHSYEITNKQRASKEIFNVITNEERKNINLGNELHQTLEHFDFIKLFDKQYVKNFISSLNKYQDYITKILNDFSNIEIFQNISTYNTEYPFYFEKNSTYVYGIIDLLIEDDKYMYIVDYKLKSTSDEEYKEQLKTYKEAMSEYTNKDIKCYLYSLLNNNIEEVKC